MTERVEHTDVGAYALGLLEEDDRLAFEAHLRGCDACAAELGQMAGLAGALAGLGPVEESPDADAPAPADEAPVIDLMRRRRAAERRFRRGTAVIGTAAAAAFLAAGVTIGAGLDDDPSAPDAHASHGPAQALVIWGERRQAADPETGASGVVGLEGKKWGTHVGLELKGIKGPLTCRLEAVSRDGTRSVVTGWRVPPQGYGVPGSPQPLVTHGGTATARADLVRFEVVVDGGRTLLAIPV
ncbi:anti-sigma factor family protein [Spirillospora albida]|uniref:anti-sigma factor family protein n=1 Tax=Spirillospora albida TaxID=58123 RepID=UPI00055F8C76|nr:zf-HC2 domain-containing protein [Spirillospora albida]